MEKFDILIIGGGPGGYEVAAEQAAAGHSVALVERAELGGTCLNRGCIPTKCLCATASRVLSIRSANEFGIKTDGATVDYKAATERMRSVVDGLRESVAEALKNVTVIRGEASITPDGSVAVDGRTYSAARVLIATGSRPARLPIPGAEYALTSDDFLSGTHELPKRLVIIGGGVIGIEFASIYNALGVDVTVLEFCREILPGFDSDVAKRLRMALQARGVRFATGAQATSIEPGYRVNYTTRRGEETADADAVLMATGRVPIVPAGVCEAGIELTERGFIAVDESMRTTREGFYAAGDVTGICMLAHAATAQARVALGCDGQEPELNIIPASVFSVPEASMVGLTKEQCEAHGVECATVRCNYAASGKALADGASGFVKIVYSPATRLILGVHVLGEHASDLVAEAAALIYGMTTIDELATDLVHGHPTLSELLPMAAKSALQHT